MFVSSRLVDHEVIPYNEIDDEGDFVRFALLAESTPINYEITLSNKV
jgi:hypothetical protein